MASRIPSYSERCPQNQLTSNRVLSQEPTKQASLQDINIEKTNQIWVQERVPEQITVVVSEIQREFSNMDIEPDSINPDEEFLTKVKKVSSELPKDILKKQIRELSNKDVDTLVEFLKDRDIQVTIRKTSSEI